MKGMNRKICWTVRQMRDLPLNIALKEDFVIIIFFSSRKIPSSLFGYRAMWNKPRTGYSIAVPRDMVTVYKSLIHRHLPFERQGSCCVDHTSHQVQTQLGMFTDTTNWNLKAYLYMAARMDFPGEYCVSKYVKLKMIPWFKPVFPQCSGRKQTATNVGGKRLWPGCLTVPFIRWNGCTSLLIFTCQSAHPKLVVT